MAAVHLHNALFMPVPSSPLEDSPNGHSPRRSSTSIISGNTSSDVLSARQFVDSMSSSQLLGLHTVPMASEPGIQLQYPYTERERKWNEKRPRRIKRIWAWARGGLAVAILIWVVYCTVRYFIAVRIYAGDHVRSRYALGMGITSAFTLVFFASETAIILRFFDDRFDRRARFIVHSFAYLSSALVMSLTIINLVLVYHWRTPQNTSQFGRSIQGRCNWDLDVVWSGTGMSCAHGHAMPFGDWLGAAIFRLVISAVLLVAYHLVVHGYPIISNMHQRSATMAADMEELDVRRPSMPSLNQPLSNSRDSQMREPPSAPAPVVPIKALAVSEDEHQRRSLSFTAAGQVLSRIEGSELDEDEENEDTSSSSSSDFGQPLEEPVIAPRSSSRSSLPQARSDSPEPICLTDGTSSQSDIHPSHYLPRSNLGSDAESGAASSNHPPSSFLRTIATPSNDLQDFASAFRNLVSSITRETQEGMTLDYPIAMSHEERPSTVRVLGSYISRMSTIDSIASREAGSPVRSSSRSDTIASLGSGSRPLSRDPTLSRGRDRDDASATPTPPGSGSSEA